MNSQVLKSDSPAEVLMLVQQDMQQVDKVIANCLTSDVALVSEVAQYIIAAGGKRLRPALLLLVSAALGYKGKQRFSLAAIVEFIHTATLLHDDVVDESTLRRGQPTANESFGNPASVLVGDFLYSRAFQMMVDVQNMRVMQVLAEATNVIAEGEVLQLMNIGNIHLTENEYIQVIRSKTAKLFEASARLAALMAKSSDAVEQACAVYGQALGTAFQIVDDILDYTGDSVQMGKNVGDDLREGKLTLPLIAALVRVGEKDQKMIQDALVHGQVEKAPQIAELVKKCGALDIAYQLADKEVQRALDALNVFEESRYKCALYDLAQQLLARRF